jgi:hypothetical protein
MMQSAGPDFAVGLQGFDMVNGELHLMAATHNLLKLFQFRRSQLPLAVATGLGGHQPQLMGLRLGWRTNQPKVVPQSSS